MNEPKELQQFPLLIRTDGHLDAHPALAHAVGEALLCHAFKFHQFGVRPENRVYGDWCDPEKRRAMEAAFEDVQRQAAARLAAS